MTLAEPQEAQHPDRSGVVDEQVETHVLAARAAFDVENYDRAIAACERLLADRPGCPEGMLLLGLISWKLDEPTQAVDLLRRAQDADPSTREYADALATILAQLGDSNESLYYAKLSTTLGPHPLGSRLLPANFAEYFLNLNFARPHTYRNRARKALDRGSFQEAVELCEKQLDLTPNEPETMRVIATALFEAGQVTSAISALHTVIRDCATVSDYANLARFLSSLGRFDEAFLAHDMAEARRPDDPELAQSRLQTLAKRHGDGELRAEYNDACRSWFDRFAPQSDKLPAVTFANPKSPDRPLRIGYVGSGLHAQGIAPILEPIIARHDPNIFETYVYCDDERQDLSTQSLMRHAERWTDISGVDSDTAAEIMRGDGLDIAVDLTGHGPGSRLLTFLYRPAPIRLGWLGVKPATPDAHDAHLVSSTSEADFALSLDHPVVTVGLPAINPAPPQSTNGHTTFGVLAPLSAIGHKSVAAWKTILDAVPGSELLVANHARHDNEAVARIYALAAHVGLSDRVTVAELEEPRAQRADFPAYMDIVLDTQPDSRFGETGEALWMGVPVLALADGGGARALSAAGKPEWIFDDLDGLREGARALAEDTEMLHQLRQQMRIALSGSALFDAQKFTAELERCYRAHWSRWCETGES